MDECDSNDEIPADGNEKNDECDSTDEIPADRNEESGKTEEKGTEGTENQEGFNREEFLLSRRKFKIKLSPDEWSTIKVAGTKYNYSSLVGHTKLFAQKIAEQVPFCSLSFKHNRVKKEGSKKRDAPFYRGSAICKFEKCLKYEFTISKPPQPGRNVKIRVRISGNLCHEPNQTKRRNVTGQDRVQMAQRVKDIGASETYYQNLANAADESLLSGNYDYVPSKLALRQMLHELVTAEMLDRDVFREIDILCNVTKDYIDGGYVKFYSKEPFSLIMFTDRQILLLRELIKSGTGNLYFDATGSIISKVPGQNERILYYALVARGKEKNPPFPLAEFVSNRHTVPDVTNFLSRIRYALERNDKKNCVPQKVEVDYSWALIHALNLAFNQCSTAGYIKRAWEEEEVSCVIHICSAHMMHCISSQAKNYEKGLKKFLMMFTAKLVEAKSLKQLTELFTQLCQICMSKKPPSDELLEQIKQTMAQRNPDYLEEEETDVQIDYTTDINTGSSWATETPYFRYFQDIKQRFEASENNETVNNMYYAPQFVTYILRRFMAIAPLWTGLLIAGYHDTNSCVENWFRIVKQDILQKKKKLRPGQFIQIMARSLSGRMKEFRLATQTSLSEPTNDDEEPSVAEEKWSKKEPKQSKKRPSYFETPKDLPKPKNAHRQKQTVHLPHCPWGGKFKNIHMSNTCTIDNFLYILFMLIQQNNTVREWLEREQTDKPVAATILRVAALFNARKWAEGKLEWIRDNIVSDPPKFVNLFGTENEFFVVQYAELQQHISTQKCNSCPVQGTDNSRRSGEFLLRDAPEMTLQSSIDQWSTDLPQQQRCKIRIRRRQCQGQRSWSARQMIGQPAVIIANVELITHGIKLGDRVNINGDMYMAHAVTMNQGGHFVSIFLYNGERFLYDGLKRKIQTVPTRSSRQKQTHLVLVKE